MYKLLLCWRYLRTRYIALASIISVMLGVATLIVVNAVMGGFSHALKDQLHGVLSDIVLESRSLDGVPDAEAHMKEIRRIAGEYIAGMSPTVQVPAMLGYNFGDQYITQQVMIVGIDEATYANVGDFGKYLQHPANRKQLDFKLKDGGYDTVDHQDAGSPKPFSDRPCNTPAGRGESRRPVILQIDPCAGRFARSRPVQQNAAEARRSDAPPVLLKAPTSIRRDEQHIGCVLGVGLCSHVTSDREMKFFALPGDDVEIRYPTAGKPPKPLSAKFTVVDFYESKMNEYDSSFVFVPIRELQKLRGMIDPATGIANCNAIQIRLKQGVDLDMVRDLLRDQLSDPDVRGRTRGATRRAPLLPPCRWRRSCSTCCCF